MEPIDVSQSTGLKRILHGKADPLTWVKDQMQKDNVNINQIEQIVHQIIDETDGNMKLAVYQNYQLFIEAAKEVGLLEAEMQIMSNMLKDQRHLLDSLTDFSLSDIAARPLIKPLSSAAAVTDSRKALSHILERVEGSSDVADVPNRVLLHQCSCTELDADSMAPIGEYQLFLLNDAILLASVSDSEQQKCSLQDAIELDNAALVKISSQPEKQQQQQKKQQQHTPQQAEMPNAFKLLVFPDTRMFCTSSADEANLLLEKVHSAKLEKAILDSERRRSSLALPSSTEQSEADAKIAWFEDKPDDLDVLLAERSFTQVVDLLLECYERLESLPTLKVMKARIDSRKSQAIRLLLKELQTPPHVSLRGGPQASRKAVKQLLRLGKTMEATEQYLQLRSSIREHLVANVKQEDSQALFAKRISATFFKTFVESLKEFQHIGFSKEAGSLLLKWCRSEIGQLADRLSTVLSSGSATFAEFAAGWSAAKANARQVSSTQPVQAAFMLDEACLSLWQSAIERHAQNLISAADARAAEEKWLVLKRSTSKQVEEFLAFIRQLQPDVTEKTISQAKYDISSMTYVFSNSFLKFTDSLAKLYTHELHLVISDSLSTVLQAELRHYKRCLSAAQLIDKRSKHYVACGEKIKLKSRQRDFILHNLNFLHSLLLTVSNEKLEAISGISYKEFDSYCSAQEELLSLIESSTPAVV